MIVRMLLRVLALAAKFGLTVMIARKLGFAAVADYGLAVAASVIASKVFGLGFSSELNRRLSGVHPSGAIRTARTLRWVYGALYLLVVAAVCVALCTDGWTDVVASSKPALFLITMVAIGEHYALESNSYVFSLHHARAGSFMLFVRTGGWAIIAIGGLATGYIVDMRLVFALWIAANVLVIVWAWRVIDETGCHRRDDIACTAGASARHGWADGIQFYVAGVMLSCLQYAERFIAAPYLTHDELGRYVFAWSVANAVQTVAYASVVVTAGPRLAKTIVVVPERFRAVLRGSLTTLLALALIMAGAILVAHEPVFRLAHEETGSVATLFILLVSFVLRSLGDLMWAAAIALKAGRHVAVGMAVLVAVSLPVARWLIPGNGQTGVALAHLFASLFIVTWLAWIVRRGLRDAALNTRIEERPC